MNEWKIYASSWHSVQFFFFCFFAYFFLTGWCLALLFLYSVLFSFWFLCWFVCHRCSRRSFTLFYIQSIQFKFFSFVLLEICWLCAIWSTITQKWFSFTNYASLVQMKTTQTVILHIALTTDQVQSQCTLYIECIAHSKVYSKSKQKSKKPAGQDNTISMCMCCTTIIRQTTCKCISIFDESVDNVLVI